MELIWTFLLSTESIDNSFLFFDALCRTDQYDFGAAEFEISLKEGDECCGHHRMIQYDFQSIILRTSKAFQY